VGNGGVEEAKRVGTYMYSGGWSANKEENKMENNMDEKADPATIEEESDEDMEGESKKYTSGKGKRKYVENESKSTNSNRKKKKPTRGASSARSSGGGASDTHAHASPKGGARRAGSHVSQAEVNAAARRAQNAARKSKVTASKEKQSTAKQKAAIAEESGEAYRKERAMKHERAKVEREKRIANADEAHKDKVAALAKANENRRELAKKRQEAQQTSHDHKMELLKIKEKIKEVRLENAQEKAAEITEKKRLQKIIRQELKEAKDVKKQEREAAATARDLQKLVKLKSKADADKAKVLAFTLYDVIPNMESRYEAIRESLAESINLTLAAQYFVDIDRNLKGDIVIDNVLFAQVSENSLRLADIALLLKTMCVNQDIGTEEVVKYLTEHLSNFTEISASVMKLEALENKFRDEQFLTDKLTGNTALEKTYQKYQSELLQSFYPKCLAQERELAAFQDYVTTATEDLFHRIVLAVETTFGESYDEAAKKITQLQGWNSDEYDTLLANLEELYTSYNVDETNYSFEELWLLKEEINQQIDQCKDLLESYSKKLAETEKKTELIPKLAGAFQALVELKVENISDNFTKVLNERFDKTERKRYLLDTTSGVFTQANLEKVAAIEPLTFAQDPTMITATIKTLEYFKSKAEDALKKA